MVNLRDMLVIESLSVTLLKHDPDLFLMFVGD